MISIDLREESAITPARIQSVHAFDESYYRLSRLFFSSFSLLNLTVNLIVIQWHRVLRHDVLPKVIGGVFRYQF